MDNGQSHSNPQDEAWAFKAGLILSYFFAGLALVAADRSFFVFGLAMVCWIVSLVALFIRFGRKSAWGLLGAPVAFAWTWPLLASLLPARGPVTI
jgi:hypothetical protein